MGDGFLGRVALVTGGGSGIGRASCLAFAREGARVAVADVDMAGAEETVRLIEGAGGSGVGFRVDVTKSGEVESLVERVVEEFGRLDCAFNNAGVGGEVMNTHEYPEDDWDRVIDVNLKGVWLCMKYEIPVMLRQGGGAIVNTALEYTEVGIRVNAVWGYMTPMTMRVSKHREWRRMVSQTPMRSDGVCRRRLRRRWCGCARMGRVRDGATMTPDGGYMAR